MHVFAYFDLVMKNILDCCETKIPKLKIIKIEVRNWKIYSKIYELNNNARKLQIYLERGFVTNLI